MKPYAYISKDGVLFKDLPPTPWLELTPLYAMRELTDEEITEVWKEHYGDVNIMTFARAILRKASEK